MSFSNKKQKNYKEEMKIHLTFTISILEDKLANHTFTRQSADELRQRIVELNNELKELR